MNLRAIVYRAEDGGCPRDIEVIRVDAACHAEDQGDDNGLGGCGFVEDPAVFDHLQKHYILVKAAGRRRYPTRWSSTWVTFPDRPHS